MKLITSAAYQSKIAAKLRSKSAKAKVAIPSNLRALGESRDIWQQILATRFDPVKQ